MVAGRAEEIKATQSILRDSDGQMVGYAIEFQPSSHSEAEYCVEQELFRSASATLTLTPTGTARFEVRNADAVKRGLRAAENLQRARDKRPSLEQEEAAQASAEKAAAARKTAADAAAKADKAAVAEGFENAADKEAKQKEAASQASLAKAIVDEQERRQKIAN